MATHVNTGFAALGSSRRAQTRSLPAVSVGLSPEMVSSRGIACFRPAERDAYRAISLSDSHFLIGTQGETESTGTHYKQRIGRFLIGTDLHFLQCPVRPRS